MKKCKRIELVVFDVDGVLTKIDSVWRFLHQNLGTWEAARKHLEMFERGEITYEEWAKYDVLLWRGISFERINKILDKVPLRSGTFRIIKFLKENNIKIATISAGLDILSNKISSLLGFDYNISNELVFENGRLTGDVIVKVGFSNKGDILLKLCESIGINSGNVLVVGDSEVDVPMMKKAGFSIAFNPTSIKVIAVSNMTIYSNSLFIILPILKMFLS